MYKMTIEKNGKKKDIKLRHNRTLKAKYLAPTNYRGSRVKITDFRHLDSIIISYDYSLNGVKEIALSELIKKGIKVNSFSYDEKSHEYIFNTYDFKTSIKGELI